MNYLLDTNVISELIARAPNQQVVDWIDSLVPETVYLSVITIGELRKGIEKLAPSRRKDELTIWLESDLLLRFIDKVVNITVDVMLVWGELTGRLEREGKTIAAIDSLIAATVLEGSYTLVTRNETDFQFTGVPLVNPWKLS
ncbi:MAG: type II toxin-antitoxin system VapC family toxin [Roseiflexaceae bacterium]